MKPFETFADEERAPVEAALERAIEALAPPLGEAAGYAIRAGGKRLRPLLTVAAYRAVGGASEAIYDVAAAVELVHTYSLLHDDLPSMDDDDLRRGRPTTHRRYGVPIATATGAALQHLAFLALARAAAEPGIAEALPDMTGRLARAAGVEGMVGGQFLDLAAEGVEVDAAGLEAIHRGKTAALIGVACTLGGLAAWAAPDDVDALSDYGTNLGLAFQIVDDLLDVDGDPARTGKAAGADAARSKATYPAVHGVQEARRHAELAAGEARAALERLGARPGVEVLEDLVDFVIDRLH